MSGIELQYQLSKFVLLGVCLIGAVLVGLLLAGAPFMLVVFLAGIAWLLTLPYHTTLAMVISIVSFNSALILPGVPGRPLWWELGAALGWSGLLVAVALRRGDPGVRERLYRNRFLFVGVLGYVGVLLLLMYSRGVGIKLLSGGAGLNQMGGRVYLQQLVCAIFPFLLLLRPLTEKTLIRLFLVQCVLTVTYLLADLIFSYSRGGLFNLLIFLELPSDGINFEAQELNFGMRRFQSLFIVSMGMLSILWVWRPMRDYANRAAFWMLPLSAALFAMGLLGGHRALIMLVVIALVVCLWAQRFLTVQRMFLFLFLFGFAYLFLKVYIRDVPLAAQRALSVLPGMEVDRRAQEDGEATMDGRRSLRKAGWEVARNYVWIGRGFGKNPDASLYEYRYDMAYYFVDNGIFFNGTIGLLVNTGVPGTFFFFLVLLGGSILTVRLLAYIRREGAEDIFLRLCCLLSSLWVAQVTSFVFLHGDSEFALRTFSLPAAMLLACDWHLGCRRMESSAPAPVVAPVEPPRRISFVDQPAGGIA